MDIVGLIPARGGSKGIPRKNLVNLAGKPLLAYTCETATKVGLARVLLSTDDPDIAATGRNYGVETPCMRPAELADDRASVVDAALHILDWLEQEQNALPDYVMLLQPTSPFRTVDDMRQTIALAAESAPPAVVSVTPVKHHPYWMKKMDANGCLTPLVPDRNPETMRQNLPPVHTLNGAIYLTRTELLRRQRTWCPQGALGYVMPPERSLDIDTLWDLRMAECLLKTGAPG